MQTKSKSRFKQNKWKKPSWFNLSALSLSAAETKDAKAALYYYGGRLEVHLFVKMASAQADVSS